MKTPEDLRPRTKRFALSIIRIFSTLSKDTVAQVLGRQVLRSGTFRAKSRADFIGKMEGALQELDETHYWLELLADAHVAPPAAVSPLLAETNELIAIFVTIVKSTKSR